MSKQYLWTTGDEWVAAPSAIEACGFYLRYAGVTYPVADWSLVPDEQPVRIQFEAVDDMPDFGKRLPGMLVEATAAEWAGEHDTPNLVGGMDY